MDWYPKPKKRPAVIGTIQWIVDEAVQASQKRETEIVMLPMQETGRRCSSGVKGRKSGLLVLRALVYFLSHHIATAAVEAAPIPTIHVSWKAKKRNTDIRGRKAREVILMLNSYTSGKMIG